MFAIVCEATGLAEEMGGFLVKKNFKKKVGGKGAQKKSEKEGKKGEGQHVKAGSVLSESHVHGPGV